jgi:hypothetical protein
MSRKDFLDQVRAMGWTIRHLPGRRHFKVARRGSVVIVADRRDAAREGLSRLKWIDAFHKRTKPA